MTGKYVLVAWPKVAMYASQMAEPPIRTAAPSASAESGLPNNVFDKRSHVFKTLLTVINCQNLRFNSAWKRGAFPLPHAPNRSPTTGQSECTKQ